MYQLRTIQVKTLSATNTQGTRIKLVDTFYNGRNSDRKTSVTIPYNYELNGAIDHGLKFCKECGIKIIGYSYNTRNYTYSLLTKDFETQLKKRG
jgi:hypothetical protein